METQAATGQLRVEGITFVAALPVEMREAVENLFFFNERQSVVRQGIREVVQRAGAPIIVARDRELWVTVPSMETQCLFACDSWRVPVRVLGVVLYARPTPEVLDVTHLAVDPEYAFGGASGGAGLGFLLVEKVREIGRRINGVRRIRLPYRRDCLLPV